MNTLFWLYKMRLNPSGEAPIMLRITHAGKRVNINLNLYINPKSWDAKRQRVKGSTPMVKEMNNLILTHTTRIMKAYDDFLKEGKPFTAEQLRDRFLGRDQVRMHLLEAFVQHNDQVKRKIGVDYTLSTWKKYETVYRKLRAFVQKRKRQDLLLQEMDRKFVQDFDFYLRTEGGCQHNTVLKNMQQIKKVLNWCHLNGWMDHDPFQGYSFKLKETVRSYLTYEEITRLVDLDLPTDRLREVRDVFVFQCFTGLAHVDVLNLKPSDIIMGIDKKRWIQIHRTKTGAFTKIPLIGPVEEIIARYREHPRCRETGRLLPVICNQAMNRALKEVAAAAKISTRISSHLGRHSYATSVTAGHGVPIETVSKLLGHKNVRTTQIYSKITDTRLAGDVATLVAKL